MAHQRPHLADRLTPSPLTPGPRRAFEPGAIERLVTAPPPLNTYRPDPATLSTTFPLVLLTGPSGTGKTHAIAALSADARVGRTLAIEWGRSGDLRQMWHIPGTRHEILTHDGSWTSITGQIKAAAVEAEHALARGDKPVVLAIDTMTAEWEELTRWTNNRARSSAQAQALRGYDPNAALSANYELWDEARTLHDDLMDVLTTFPGIVVTTARAGWAPAVDRTTNQTNGTMVRRVYAERSLEADATLVLQLDGPDHWSVVKCSDPTTGLNPRGPEPRRLAEGTTLADLLFDHLHIDPSTTVARINGRPRPLGRIEPAPWVDSSGAFSPLYADTDRWNTEIMYAEQDLDLDRLTALWIAARRHRPDRADIAHTIAQAGQRVRDQRTTTNP